jgi:hypothetical protein
MSAAPLQPDEDDRYRAAFAVGFLIGALVVALVTRCIFL